MKYMQYANKENNFGKIALLIFHIKKNGNKVLVTCLVEQGARHK